LYSPATTITKVELKKSSMLVVVPRDKAGGIPTRRATARC
jgi:hypothetical protein